MGRVAALIVLSAAEHAELDSLARAHNTGQAMARRARIVLAAAAGRANKAICVEVGAQVHHDASLAMRWGPVLPGTQPALRHPHQAAQMAARQTAAIVGNMLKPHGFWAARNIASFSSTSLHSPGKQSPDCFLIRLKPGVYGSLCATVRTSAQAQQHYQPAKPPSTLISDPVMYPACAEHRNSIASAISSGCAIRPAMISCDTRS